MANRFIIGKSYRLYVTGFPEPVEGEIIDIDISEDTGIIALIIEKNTNELVTILASAITGVEELPKIRTGKAA